MRALTHEWILCNCKRCLFRFSQVCFTNASNICKIYIVQSSSAGRMKKKQIKNRKKHETIVACARKGAKDPVTESDDRWPTAFLLLAFLYKAHSLGTRFCMQKSVFSPLLSPFHALSRRPFFLCALPDRLALSLPSLSPPPPTAMSIQRGLQWAQHILRERCKYLAPSRE